VPEGISKDVRPDALWYALEKAGTLGATPLEIEGFKPLKIEEAKNAFRRSACKAGAPRPAQS